jgi:peptide/nickel transport system permease protein
MVILWTDALIYLLLVCTIVFAYYLHDKDHFQRPLKKIAGNSVGMVSAILLLFFLCIGLVDSVHFKSSESNNEIISLFDYFASHLKSNNEKTYSSPFATTLFNKEMVNQNGTMVWDYPRLVYGGAHLQNPENEKFTDILVKSAYGFFIGTGCFFLVLLMILGRRYLANAAPNIIGSKAFNMPIMITLFITLTLSSIFYYLSHFYHVLGTDKVGEDVFYQAIKSIRTGLIIGTLTTLIMLPLAIVFGILAGYFQGWVDDIIQYIYTTLNSIPGVLLIAASVLMVQVYMANHEDQFTSIIVRADMRLLFLCMILGVTSWTGLCRLLRAETLKLREMEYVQAAYALGVKQHTILIRHILPNVMHIVLISVVLDFSALVLAEAVLSYINIGVDPTTYSWGNMINGARLEMAREPVVWWSLFAAFLFMFALVLAANLFADTVQEAFDPRSITNERAQ